MAMTKPQISILGLATLSTVLAGCAAQGGNDLAAQLHTAHADQPFMGGQATPDHEWTFVNSNRNEITFLHWMGEDSGGKETGGDSEKADVLFATGSGFKGRWCRGDAGATQAEIDAGFVHFHKESSANWDAGHGGSQASQVGFWLRHVAAGDGVEMMPGVVSQKGKVYPLMPSTTNLPDC